jgi:ferrous iron transport protein B
MESEVKIALAGNPNAGKTTLFNALTGARQHVGNYPGVTVEKKEGIYTKEGHQAKIIDLPGTYSMSAYSEEEVVSRDFLINEKPQAIINIVDASNIERNLYLTCQFLELGIPIVIALNMIDVAKDRGIEIDAEKLSALLGVPVVPIVARVKKGISELMQAVMQVASEKREWQPVSISYGDDVDNVLLQVEAATAKENFLSPNYPARWVAIKYLENDEQIKEIGRKENKVLAAVFEEMVDNVADHLKKTLDMYPESIISDHRYGFIKAILRQGVVSQTFDRDRLYTSDKIDKVLTNRFLGPLIMLAVLLGLYKFTFTYSAIPMGWLENLFGWLGSVADNFLSEGPLKSMFISGVIDGVGGVLGFVPMIMFMFFGIAFLEDFGYLARVAFMMDRVFRVFGLHGSSVMSYIISGGIAGGCAVPGVMATRTLRSPKERMATLLTTPFMNCGAKLPVLALLTGTFFAKNQAQIMFMFTLLAWVVALIAAKILRSTILRGESTPFVMELPPYRFPTFKGLLIHTWEKTWQYIKKAGTVILGVSILLWAMMTYPGLSVNDAARYEQQRESVRALFQVGSGELSEDHRQYKVYKERMNAVNAAAAEYALRYSVAGRIGSALEKISWLPGFDWRTNIALVGGFAAKEVIVSTLGTAYSLGEVDPEASGTLSETLATDPGWNPVKALSLVVFIMFYAPCFVTVVCIVREAGSWKWGAFSIVFNTIFAFTLATLVYRVGLILGYGG